MVDTVGASRLATGPHLHQELVIEGCVLDPTRADLPEVARLQGSVLASPKARRRALERQIAQLKQGWTEVAPVNNIL